MKKIPLETTLVGAYRFLFTNIVSIVGTLWLPLVVMAALIGGIVYLVVPHAWLNCDFSQFDAKHFDPKLLLPLLYAYPLLVIAMLVMVSMMFVGLMRHSLGQKKSTTFVYFSLGANTWRLALGIILVEILLIVLACVLVAVFMLVKHFALPMVPHGPAVAIKIVLIIVEICFFLYASLRLVFFLPAVVAAENRIGLGRSWSLGGGNFWRMFFVLLLVYIPVGFIAGIILQMTVMPVVLTEAMKMGHHPGMPEMTAFFHALRPLLPTILIVGLLQRIATLGLLSGAIGSAYNAVAAPEEKASA